MKNAGKTEDWLIERASGVWRKDPLRAILELFPFGTDPKYSLVRLQEPWRSRYPNCEYGLDAWACEVCDRIALRVADHDFDMVNAVDPIRVAVASGHGPGKLEPLDNEIDTPQGRRKFGELKVGDLVFGVDGQPTRIVGIPYRGVRPCYKVTFDDGASVVVGREHLWRCRVASRGERIPKDPRWVSGLRWRRTRLLSVGFCERTARLWPDNGAFLGRERYSSRGQSSHCRRITLACL